MDKKLKAIFDYQRFAGNDRLSRLIEESKNRFKYELTDDELWLVNAAGAQLQPEEEKHKPEKA